MKQPHPQHQVLSEDKWDNSKGRGPRLWRGDSQSLTVTGVRLFRCVSRSSWPSRRGSTWTTTQLACKVVGVELCRSTRPLDRVPPVCNALARRHGWPALLAL